MLFMEVQIRPGFDLWQASPGMFFWLPARQPTGALPKGGTGPHRRAI